MPELPEVETIVRDLKKVILNKEIATVKIKKKNIVKSGVSDLKNALIGKSFNAIRRRAKFLVFKISDSDKYLLVHLRMTGQLIYQDSKKTVAGGHEQGNEEKFPNKYSHIILEFKDSSRLFYNDMRQFGVWKIVEAEKLEDEFKNFGVDPLTSEFVFDLFLKLIQNKKTSIKAFLLNQKHIAGIGNIYADEILFASGIKPGRKTESLKKEEKRKIFISIKKILQKAIKMRGTTFSDYRDSQGQKGNFSSRLKVYGRAEKKCKKCAEKIKKTRVAGRGTYYCEKCQK